MGDDGSSIGRVAGFDPAEEVEEGCRVLGDTVIGPGRELELTHLSPFTAATLTDEQGKHIWKCLLLGIHKHSNKKPEAFLTLDIDGHVNV